MPHLATRCCTTTSILTAAFLPADDRFRQAHQANVDIRDLKPDGMPFYEAALHINRLYAQRHGYTFLSQEPKPGPDFDRNVVWLKLKFLREMLECCCSWALFMDSDSFFVMHRHSLSIEAWLTQQEMPGITTLLGNMHHNIGTALRQGVGPVAIVSRNFPASSSIQYFCAGNLLFTRTRLSIEILDFWYDTARLDPSSKHTFPMEQGTLNTYVMPKYSKALWVASFEDFNSKDGNIIHHLWTPYGDAYRTKHAVKHLKSIISHFIEPGVLRSDAAHVQL